MQQKREYPSTDQSGLGRKSFMGQADDPSPSCTESIATPHQEGLAPDVTVLGL